MAEQDPSIGNLEVAVMCTGKALSRRALAAHLIREGKHALANEVRKELNTKNNATATRGTRCAIIQGLYLRASTVNSNGTNTTINNGKDKTNKNNTSTNSLTTPRYNDFI